MSLQYRFFAKKALPESEKPPGPAVGGRSIRRTYASRASSGLSNGTEICLFKRGDEYRRLPVLDLDAAAHSVRQLAKLLVTHRAALSQAGQMVSSTKKNTRSRKQLRGSDLAQMSTCSDQPRRRVDDGAGDSLRKKEISVTKGIFAFAAASRAGELFELSMLLY